MTSRTIACVLVLSALLSAQDAESVVLKTGTRIPLTLMNTISSKGAAPGDRVYLRTMIPVAVDGRVVIPPGTYVFGTITDARRPGRVSGKGELALRFESLMFANGVTIDLRGRIGALDGENPGGLNREENKVASDGSIGRDATVVAGTVFTGTWMGGRGSGAGIGAAAGAAAGVGTVLLTRGPEAALRRGSMIEMVLNRDLRLTSSR